MSTDSIQTKGARSGALPVLLLIPGMLNTGRIWSRVVPLLQGLADVRIADVTRQSSIAEMAKDAWNQVSDVPADQHLAVCGFSMGGYVALDLFATYIIANNARYLSTLGLLNTSSRGETAQGMVDRGKTIAALEKNFERVIQGIAGFGIHPSHNADEALMTEILSIMREAGANTAIRQLRAIMARSDQRSVLPRIAARTLVMTSRHDRVVPAEASHELATQIPEARLEWIEPAGHMTPLEQPAQLATLLKTIL
jgi:pimeloyl-ACP methyl ester carboxylesterase